MMDHAKTTKIKIFLGGCLPGTQEMLLIKNRKEFKIN